MTRRPWGGDELGGDPDLEPAGTDLERYLADTAADPSSGFADRVMSSLATEPIPRRGLLAAISAAFGSERGRLALIAATIVVAVMAVVAVGQLSQLLQVPPGSSSPQPSLSVPVSASPSPSPSVVPSPSPTDEDDASESPDEPNDQSGRHTVGGSGNSGPGGS
jgi:hypothetical protein